MKLLYVAQYMLAQAEAKGFWTEALEYVQGTALYKLIATDRNGLILLSCWILAFFIGKMITNHKTLKNYKEHWVFGFMLLYCNVLVWVSGTRPGVGSGKTEIAAGTGISGDELGYRLVLGIILAGGSILIPALLYWWFGSKYFVPAKLGQFLRKHMFLQE